MGRITWAHLETKAEACDGRAAVARSASEARERSDRAGSFHFARVAERHAAEALRWRQIRAAFERGVFLCDPGSTNAADVEWLQMERSSTDLARQRCQHRSQLSGMERVEAGIDSDYARGLDATPRPGSRRSICR